MNHLLPSSDPPDLPRRAEVVAIPAVIRAPYAPGGLSYGPEGLDFEDSEGGLVEYLRMLRRHTTAIILTALAGLLIGFGVGIPMKPVYRARTSIEILNVNEDFMNTKQTSPVTTTDSSYDTSEEETQSKLLQSHDLMIRVLGKLDPGIESAREPEMATSGWRRWLHLHERVQLTERQRLLTQLASSLKIRPTAHTRVVEITADSTDRQLAAAFADTLVQEFIQQNLEARFATTNLTSDWLTREIDDARTSLKNSEDALQEYARSSGLIFTDESTNVATEKLQQVQQQLSVATADRIAKQARFEMAKNSPPEAVADVLSDPGLQNTTSKLNDLRRRVADLGAIYNSEYGPFKRAKAELAVTQAMFEQTRTDILKRIENDYMEAVTKEKLLATAYDAQTREVTGQDEKAIQYNILKREVDSGRQLYDTMLQQTKQSSIASALRASNVRLVDHARAPKTPVSPNLPLNSAIGLLAGLFLSIAGVTIRERADRALRQPGDVKTWTNLTELGTIPSARAGVKIYGRAPVTNMEIELSTAGKQAVTLSKAAYRKGRSVELTTWHQKPSFIAEAFRSTLTSIFFVGENGSGPRVLVFTSAHAADGKTTVVSNLAIAAAEIRRKVLVIDADLRRSRIHNIFDVPNERGLSDILREELSEENVRGLIQETKIPSLHVLTAGKATRAAAHLLYSRNFAPLLAKLREEYDMILIDTPPMLQMTDARIAGRFADAVVLVARAGETTRDAMLAAKERLNEDGIRILGTVLNDWNPKKSPGGYYGRYQENYYSRYAASKSDAPAPH